MRKLLAIIAISLTALAVSCTREQELSSSGSPVRVSYTVDGLAKMATKTMGNIGSDYILSYEVRLWDGSALGDKLIGDGLSGYKTVGASEWPATVSFELARGKQYKILFWAQSVDVPEYLFLATDLTAVAIDYEHMAANNENCDAFYGADVITPSGATAASVTLQRPFALVNLGTSDAVHFHTASGGCTVGDVKVTVSGSLANSFNVATGKAGAGVDVTFAPNAAPAAPVAPVDTYDAATLSVNSTDFNYLSAVYVLPPEAGSGLVDLAYVVKDNTEATLNSLEVTNVPVQANYRTNITGKLLTGTTTYNITVDQAFGGNTVKEVCPTFASVDDLNDYFETMADNSDHGDINPEEVILTSIADGETIVLPAIAGNVVMRIPAVLETGTLYIAYASEGDKPANVSLYVTKLQNLTADITSSHFTLLDGSWITGTANVSTSGTTFVVEQGARIGTAQIAQGNASISGEVARVEVPTDATADGASAPVYVFLTPESAVEKIFLNAQTDVVVEQPKDQIDVVATEKKVAVYVNTGAENSTAKAQNGGVIYVEANVPCTVTADGVSTAEEGIVSSTVIINSTAGNSEVVATNGGAIKLTANADCEVTSTGASEETSTPSSVTVAEVNTGAEVSAVISEGGQVNVSPGVESDAVDVREGVAFANCIVYTPGVEASVENNNIVFSRVKVNAAESTFANAIAYSTSGQVIELTKNIDFSGQTITVAGGVAIDFAGYTLTADKVVGNNGKVLFKQSKKYDSVLDAAAEVAQGYLSYVGAIENVEIWGGTYSFDPQDYTPAGIALVANGADFDLSGKWFVPAIPEAVVYHGTPQEMEDNNISFEPYIMPIERNGSEVLINFSNPVGNLSLPVENGAYAFLSDDDESPLTSVVYQDWIADFIVSIDQATNIAGIIEAEYNTLYPIPSWGIWGAYGGMQFAPALCFNLAANERFPLLGSMGMGWNYYQMRNTVQTFICGAVNVHPGNVGKVVTAELCIAPSSFSSMAEAIEADEFIVVGKYSYTMEKPYYNITQFPGLVQ